MLGGFVMHEHFAMVDNLLSTRPYAYHSEIVCRIARHNIDVGALARRQRTDIGQLERARRIDSHHLDGLHERQATAKGELQMMVKVSRLIQIATVQVVGHDAHHRSVDVFAHDTFELLRERARSRRFAQHRMDSHASAIHDFVGGKRFVAR